MYILAQCYYEVKGDYIANNVTIKKADHKDLLSGMMISIALHK